jgi:hypothetical protein
MDRSARGPKFAPSPFGERCDTHRLEHVVCCAQVLAGVDAPAFPP